MKAHPAGRNFSLCFIHQTFVWVFLLESWFFFFFFSRIDVGLILIWLGTESERSRDVSGALSDPGRSHDTISVNEYAHVRESLCKRTRPKETPLPPSRVLASTGTFSFPCLVRVVRVTGIHVQIAEDREGVVGGVVGVDLKRGGGLGADPHGGETNGRAEGGSADGCISWGRGRKGRRVSSGHVTEV